MRTQQYNYFPNILISKSLLSLITIQPKILRRKEAKKYKAVMCDDVNEDLYIFKYFEIL